MNEGIAAKLLPIFRDVFDDESIVIGAGTAASDIAGWDSLSHIRLVMAVEHQFKVKFSAKEINDLKNVGEFVGLIQSKLSIVR